MFIIARDATSLEGRPDRFSVEALSAVLSPELITQALAESGVQDGRCFKLPARFTVWIVLLLCLFRERSYRSILKMLSTAASWRGLWKGTSVPTTSALSRARDRVGVDVMRRIFEASVGQWIESSKGKYLGGLRLSAIDGTCAKVPDCPNNHTWFGRPGASRGRAGYPQLRLVGLMDVGTRMQRAVQFGPYRTAEMTLARALMPDLAAGLLILLDRNFASYDLLWDILQHGSHFVVRVKHNMKAHVIRELGAGDRLVEIQLPRRWRKDRPDLPRTMILRETRYTPSGGTEEIRLFTSLTDPDDVSAQEIAAAYHERWSEETGIAEIKCRLGMITTITRPALVRSKTPSRVRQEIWALLTVYNALRMTMVQAATIVTNEDLSPTRISFNETLHQVRDGVRDMMQLPTSRLIERYQRLQLDIADEIVPLRPGRTYPRAVKIKMSGYPLKRSA